MKRYVVDTQGILWHLAEDRRLSRRAGKILDYAEEGYAQVLVPSIVLVEAIFLMQRWRIPEAQVSKLFELSENAEASICVVPLNMAVAQAVSDFWPGSDSGHAGPHHCGYSASPGRTVNHGGPNHRRK